MYGPVVQLDSLKFIFSMVIYYNYDNAFELSHSSSVSL